MRNTNNVKEFIKHNDKELRYLISNLCMKHGLCSEASYRVHTVNDIIQDIYLRFLTNDIITDFDLNRQTNPKISTYLYPIIRNLLRTYKKSSRIKMARGIRHSEDPRHDDVDIALYCNTVSSEFQAIIDHNSASDEIDSLRSDLDDFETRYLSKRDKTYSLSKRKIKDAPTKGCTLTEIYRLLNDGFTNREIAQIYGVSDMWVSLMKAEIATALKKYGIVWKPKRRKTRSRRK